jgi:hypothetical protein
MKMPDEDREHLYDTLGTLETMVENEIIDPQWYYKALVDGAHQHLVAKEMGAALALLGKVPPKYYAEGMLPQMEADPAYSHQVVEIATLLVNHNVVHVGWSETEIASMQEA